MYDAKEVEICQEAICGHFTGERDDIKVRMEYRSYSAWEYRWKYKKIISQRCLCC